MKHNRPHKLGPRAFLAQRTPFSRHRWLSIGGALAVVGLFAVVLIRASGSFVSFEPESGTRNGVTLGSDSAASGGSYIKFGSTATPSGLAVNASQTVRPFSRGMRGIALANWTFTKTPWGKPYVGDIQGLPQAIKAIDPGLIRYAGGLWANYVGFDRTASLQHAPNTDWTKNGHTYSFSYGTDELKSLDGFAKSVNADVMIQVNISQNDPAMWADLAAYAKQNSLTSIKYYELSNELDLETFTNKDDKLDPATYATRVAAYSNAILAADPSVGIVGGVAATASDIMRNNYSCCGNQVSQYITGAVSAAHGTGHDLAAASYHWYQAGGDIGVADVTQWSYGNAVTSPDWWRGSYSREWSGIAPPWVRAAISTSSTKLGVSELGINSSDNEPTNGNFIGALWYSDVLGRLAYNGVDWVTQWDSYASSSEYFSLLYPDSDSSTTPTLNLRPTYYAYAMYDKYFGDTLVSSSTDDPANISIWASTDSSDPGKLKLRVTNMSSSPITKSIALSGFSAKSALAYVLASNNPTDLSASSASSSANVTINGTKLNASNVAASLAGIAGQAVTVSANSVSTTFPAYSSTAIVVTPN